MPWPTGRQARQLLMAKLTRPDGELTDHGQDIAEEQHDPYWTQQDDDREPGPVHPDANVY